MPSFANDLGNIFGPLESGLETVLVVVEQQPLEAVFDRPQHVGFVVVVRVHPRPTAASAATEARAAGIGPLVSLCRDQPVHVSPFSSVILGLFPAGRSPPASASAAPLQAVTAGSTSRVLA